MAFRALRPAAVKRACISPVFTYVTRRSFFNMFKSAPTAQEIITQQAQSKPILVNEVGEKVLYESAQRHQIRAMMAGGVVNGMYWTYHLVNAYQYSEVVIGGIEMGGDPMWGYLGLGISAFIAATTREFARHAVYRAYVSADGFRVGFQMHNPFGSLGRKIEAKPTNITIGQVSKARGNLLPLLVQGIETNILLDLKGNFFGKNVLQDIITDKKIPDFLKIDGILIKSSQLINTPIVSSLLGDTETSPAGVLISPIIEAATAPAAAAKPLDTVPKRTAESAVPLNSLQTTKVSRRPPTKFRGQNGKR